MPTLYVENVPDELYEALRERARRHKKSISAEVISLLESNVPTPTEIAKRHESTMRILRLQEQYPIQRGPFQSAEEMIREDRDR